MTGNKTQRQMTGLSYRFATLLIALLFVATGKLQAQTAYYSFDGSTMTIYYGSSIPSGCTAVGDWDSPNWLSKTTAYSKEQDNATKIIFDKSFSKATPTSCRQWFYKFSKVKAIEGIENLNTETVTNMHAMFSYCAGLNTIDLSNFKTDKVTNMAEMFYGCTALNKIDVSKFNTSNVEDMSGMFNFCSALTSLDVSNFNTSKVKNMNLMFSSCWYVPSLDLTNFDTSNVTQMNGMFQGCFLLTTLDLSSFNTDKVDDMSYMFQTCPSLATIYASDKFKVDNVTESTEMFIGCSSLVGVIPYDASKLDKKWANNVTGYFMPYYEDKDGKHPIYDNGVKKVTRLDLYNQNPFYTQTTFNIDEGSYTRESMRSDWGTVCVPFVIDVAQSNCTFYQLTSVGKEAIEISPITEDEIAAGKSVFVKRKDGETDLKVIAKPCEIVADPANETGANHLQGTFQDIKISKKCYFLASNKFWYVGQIADDGEIKGVLVYPFRSYLTCDDNAQQANSLNIVVKDETSGVENPVTMDSLFSDKAEYYDAAGRRIDALQKGLNIVRVGGQTRKVIIK